MVVEITPVAPIRMRDPKAQDQILCVTVRDPNWNHIETLDDLPMTLRDEVSHVFGIHKTPEWQVVKFVGWYSRGAAMQTASSRRRRSERLQRAGVPPVGSGATVPGSATPVGGAPS